MPKLTVRSDGPPHPCTAPLVRMILVRVPLSLTGPGVLFGVPLAVGGVFCHRSKQPEGRGETARLKAWLVSIQRLAEEINARDELPEVEAGINPTQGERCLWLGRALWSEYRKDTRRVSHSGLTASIPIATGLRDRVSSLAVSPERESSLVAIDGGTLHVTSKRLFFDGGEKVTSLPWKNLARVHLFQGGIVLNKNTGRDPHLMIESGAESVAILLARASAGSD